MMAPIRVMNVMIREVMKEVVCQVSTYYWIGEHNDDEEDKECVFCAVCTKAVAMQMALPTL